MAGTTLFRVDILSGIYLHLSILSIHLSIHLSIYPIYPSVYPSVHPSMYHIYPIYPSDPIYAILQNSRPFPGSIPGLASGLSHIVPDDLKRTRH